MIDTKDHTLVDWQNKIVLDIDENIISNGHLLNSKQFREEVMKGRDLESNSMLARTVRQLDAEERQAE